MRPDSIRLLVIDADPIKKAMYEDSLAGMQGIEVAGIAYNQRAALELAKGIQPDVMLIDLMLPGYRSITVIEQGTEMLPRVRTLAVSPGARLMKGLGSASRSSRRVMGRRR